MYFSKLFIPTLRDNPSDAEIVSHRLMLRGGYIRKVAAGIYSFLPLGLRVLYKVEQIIREEMNTAGAQEVRLPALQPSELWEETGRWAQYGKELMRVKDRHNRDFCLGPTHEEVITDLIRNEVRSYKQLPLNLYQIQTKFRDEIRPRFGLMRGREFVMKDAYSFDADIEEAKATYQGMYETYQRIFKRVGLDFRAVEADAGMIGGSSSHEFMVLAETGEDDIASCSLCDYAANVERAELLQLEGFKKTDHEEAEAMCAVTTPGKKSVEEVCEFLKLEATALLKTLLFLADDRIVAVLVRGDHEVNEIKLRHQLAVTELVLADKETVKRVTKGPSGYSGPVALKDIEILADYSVAAMPAAVIGANQKDTHYIQAIAGRDFNVDTYADLRNAVAGDSCPRCREALVIDRGIEVGHVFMLGTKYSEAMQASFLDQNGKDKPFVMGCYGIGVSRIMAAAIEQNHDERGMIWPISIAPFAVEVIPVQEKKEAVLTAAKTIYTALTKQGIETLFEDRKERAGVKFNDADLLGIPFQVVVGQKNLEQGLVELKDRRTGEKTCIPIDEVEAFLLEKCRCQ